MKHIYGYPLVFRNRSVNLGGFYEFLSPQSVDRALRDGSNIVALVNHDASKPLGRTTAGTSMLRKDDHGLAIDIPANEAVSFVADALELIRRGDADGGSFGFEVLDDIWTKAGDTIMREILDMELREISACVTFPAYVHTRLSVRRAA